MPIGVHIAREQLDVDDTSGGVSFTALSAANRAKFFMAAIQIQVAQVRVTFDGSTAPVAATTGTLKNPGDEFEIWGIENFENLKFIEETTTNGIAVMNAWGRT
jgi:copper(I)-binding protein